ALLLSAGLDLGLSAGLGLCLGLCLGLSLSLSACTPTTADLEHLGTAHGACTSCSRTAVLHCDLLFSLHFPVCFALYTVSRCSHLRLGFLRYDIRIAL